MTLRAFVGRLRFFRTVSLVCAGIAFLTMGFGSAAAHAEGSTVYRPAMPLSGSCVLTETSDGSVWFLEMVTAKIARLDPATGRIDEYPVPWSPRQLTGPVTQLPCSATTATDGNVYFTNGLNNQIGKLDPRTTQISLFDAPNPLGNLYPFNDITTGPDNAVWFSQSTGNAIGRFDLASHKFTDYPVPTPATLPIGIFAASDGGVWFGEPAAGKVGRIDVATKQVTEYKTPSSLSAPQVIRGESEGRYVWFGEAGANSLGRIDTLTRQITEYRIPWLSVPNAPCVSAAGNVYFGAIGDFGAIGEFSPKTGQFNRIRTPDAPLSQFPEVICGQQANTVWAVGYLPTSTIVRISTP